MLHFVCPTPKLIVKQVNYQTRIGETMNFNLFRREWKGSVQESIADQTMHSFCDISHPGKLTNSYLLFFLEDHRIMSMEET